MEIREYLKRLGSTEPAPGGGAAAAVTAAEGMALLRMALSLTLPKKSFQEKKEEIQRLIRETEEGEEVFFSFWKQDEEAFLRLAEAWKEEKGSPERERKTAEGLKGAAEVPMNLLREIVRRKESCLRMRSCTSRLLLSDTACGLSALRSAAEMALFNVRANTRYMKESEEKSALLRESRLLFGEAQAFLNDETEKCLEELEDRT